MTQHLMLLDSASLYFRAFYGVPDQRRSPEEPPTNAVRGFLDMLATLVGTHRPTHLVACWDNDWRPAFRVNAIPTYKTHRLSEGSLVQEESPRTSRHRCR
jgi:5'-3' exonuclease